MASIHTPHTFEWSTTSGVAPQVPMTQAAGAAVGRTASNTVKERRSKSRPRSNSRPRAPLRPTNVNGAAANGGHVPRPTKSKATAMKSGSLKASDTATRAASRERSTKSAKTTKPAKRPAAPPPPKMTASYVMGVQQRPRPQTRSQKPAAAKAAYAELLREASQVEGATAKVREAEELTVTIVAAARAIANKERADPSKDKNGKAKNAKAIERQMNAALRAAGRLAGARASLLEASRVDVRSRCAQEQVRRYTDA
jgi:hypothetical protein